MNAGDDDSDDGLILAGDAAMPPFNPMGIVDPNMDMNFQKLG